MWAVINTMFCPSCGVEERQMSQYCRACGTDLRPVRVSMERPDSITASAVSARAEIGRAMADRIREANDAAELKIIADDVLPRMEKFLESPDDKRLRRTRAGVLVAAGGLGIAVLFLLVATAVRDVDVPPFVGLFGLGAAIFFVGLGMILNALLFTRPRKGGQDQTPNLLTANHLNASYGPPQLRGEARPTMRAPAANETPTFGSVTESTTHHLK